MKTSLVTTAPAAYPVSLTEAKTQLRIVSADTTYDTEVTRLITAATQWVERRYGISIITQTRTQLQDNFYEKYPIFRNFLGPYYSRYPVTLLYPPVQSVTFIKYYDTSGVLQTLSPSEYTVAGLMTPTAGAQDIETPRIWPNNSWPVFKWIPDTIQIKYVAGFGDDSTKVPEVIKTAVLMVISGLFENRQEEGVTPDRLIKFEMSIDRIMSTYENFQHVNLYA